MNTMRWPVKNAQILMLAGMMLFSQSSYAEENSLQRIQREGVLHAATEPAFEPFEFMQDGKIVGYGTDILHEVAKRMGVKLDQQGMPFSAVLPSLIAHKVDLAATTLVATPERRSKMAFTASIAERSLVIITRTENDKIKTKEDLSGTTVGIQQGSAFGSELKKVDDEFKKNKKEGLKKIIEYQSFSEIQLALLGKQIDATFIPLTMAATWNKKQSGKFRIVGMWEPQASIDDDKYNYYWAVRKNEPQLKRCIDDILVAMIDDGTISTLQIKWFGQKLSSIKN